MRLTLVPDTRLCPSRFGGGFGSVPGGPHSGASCRWAASHALIVPHPPNPSGDFVGAWRLTRPNDHTLRLHTWESLRPGVCCRNIQLILDTQQLVVFINPFTTGRSPSFNLPGINRNR